MGIKPESWIIINNYANDVTLLATWCSVRLENTYSYVYNIYFIGNAIEHICYKIGLLPEEVKYWFHKE